MKRLFDIVLGLVAAIVFFIPCVIVAVLVKVTSPGPVLFWSDRVGRDNRIFRMPKFRSMRNDTPNVATHLLTQPESYITPLGRFIRKTSLDELPQIWSILVGEMSIVGPRPALFNQDDLIALRTETGVHRLRPGLTGLAQVKGRDNLSVPEKVVLDAEYLRTQSLALDVKILFWTIRTIFSRGDISH
ncbi:UDP-phosphate galactose phosphotransferase [Meridianimarinicoccus roseus]|uniref:UDP-phosphate galactose phosphotransferase n=1 Tax=Meridianimarinicoccus roseus TaxID=2072018 RepID=A0A2V2LI82_9RHOB|nr:UDP-phosphate galactose phosphotransferase [Meridianimarinicoccus roseus]